MHKDAETPLLQGFAPHTRVCKDGSETIAASVAASCQPGGPGLEKLLNELRAHRWLQHLFPTAPDLSSNLRPTRPPVSIEAGRHERLPGPNVP